MFASSVNTQGPPNDSYQLVADGFYAYPATSFAYTGDPANADPNQPTYDNGSGGGIGNGDFTITISFIEVSGGKIVSASPRVVTFNANVSQFPY